jgi:hypothetical protein
VEISSEEEEKKTDTSLPQIRLGRRQKKVSLDRFLVKVA